MVSTILPVVVKRFCSATGMAITARFRRKFPQENPDFVFNTLSPFLLNFRVSIAQVYCKSNAASCPGAAKKQCAEIRGGKQYSFRLLHAEGGNTKQVSKLLWVTPFTGSPPVENVKDKPARVGVYSEGFFVL